MGLNCRMDFSTLITFTSFGVKSSAGRDLLDMMGLPKGLRTSKWFLPLTWMACRTAGGWGLSNHDPPAVPTLNPREYDGAL
jgi:hypothetical protein